MCSSDLEPAEEFAVLAHEIGHELLHRGERRALTSKTIRETEAEAVAFVVCRAVGLEALASASEYMQIWNGDASVLHQSLEAVQETAAVILAEIFSEPASGASDTAREVAASAASHSQV